MSASGEVDDVEMPVEPKPVKEMKPKASKQTKTASHPPYFEVIVSNFQYSFKLLVDLSVYLFIFVDG